MVWPDARMAFEIVGRDPNIMVAQSEMDGRMTNTDGEGVGPGVEMINMIHFMICRLP